MSDRNEIYVQACPSPGEVKQVTLDGGLYPAWNPNGRELFFVSQQPDAPFKRRMMAVDVAPGPPVRIGPPRALFEFDGNLVFNCVPARCYDVSQDGQQFFVKQFTAAMAPPPVVTHVNLITNWFEELKAKVPPAK